MKHLLKTVVLYTAVSITPIYANATSYNSETRVRNEFQFAIAQYHTARQSGQTVNLYVKFAYKKDLPTTDYVDYRELRKDVLTYMEPTETYPMDTFWEILATKMGDELMEKYPLDGVSVHLEVMDNTDPNRFEPGDHGPTYTVGDITPLDIHTSYAPAVKQ